MTTATSTIPRYFSQHPEDVARRHRCYLETIAPLQAQLVRLYGIFPPPRVWYMAAGSNVLEDMSPPWEDGLPEEVRKFVEHVRSHIRATAAEYGFDSPP